ncbi:uncharacterized protein LOC133832943 [Humulus lupulus]|uniref:uncharacterized protein LOC133832943 n=1 Tax=Humulus lupulus TaxID=3486 RepID=UPI002B41589A|nr:uncharacterized protein LOC133832943 [Humulus lupulus]
MEHHFPTWDFYSSSVIEGRLLIIWRKTFAKIIVIEESSQYVHCVVRLAGLQQFFGVTFVYGVNTIEGRKVLWEGLHCPAFLDKAWLIIGDFNAPFSSQDRSCGKPVSKLELADPIHWLVEAHVEPLRRIGSYFTWTNNQQDAARIYSKIDHALTNEKWIDMFPQSIEFRDLVTVSWRSPLRATGIKAIFFKLLRLKHSLKGFNRDTVGDLKAAYYRAKEAYQEAQMQAQAHPQVYSYQEEERKAVASFSVQEKSYHNFLMQRKEGKVVDNFSEVVSHFMNHFRCFLGSPSSATSRINLQIVDLGSKLSTEQQLQILKPFSKKEIRESLFSIPPTKSPGPDGFGSGFFKASWPVVGDEVCSAISHCFESGYFPSNLHETTFSLIPKVANPSRAVDYRPIACCSTLYKCMAKLICKRLALVLPDLVQPNQGAFVKGRSIAHNIMIFQDLIKHYGRISTSSRCAIKIDICKAYDTVDWDFLEDLLRALNFPQKFIG